MDAIRIHVEGQVVDSHVGLERWRSSRWRPRENAVNESYGRGRLTEANRQTLTDTDSLVEGVCSIFPELVQENGL